jgi:hypothetical protein
MRMISLRRLLSKLTVLALASSPAAATAEPTSRAQCSSDGEDGDLDSDLPIDREHVNPRAAAAMLGRTLAQALVELRPLAATHLATTWALSEDCLRRAAIAHALERVFPLFGDRAIVAHLAGDSEPYVREVALRAASVRRVV